MQLTHLEERADFRHKRLVGIRITHETADIQEDCGV